MPNNSGNISVEKQQSLRASTEVKKALEQVNSLSTKTSVKPSSDNTNSFNVTKNDGTSCFKVDTTNNRSIFGANKKISLPSF